LGAGEDRSNIARLNEFAGVHAQRMNEAHGVWGEEPGARGDCKVHAWGDLDRSLEIIKALNNLQRRGLDAFAVTTTEDLHRIARLFVSASAD
jgi:hypothetical protein